MGVSGCMLIIMSISGKMCFCWKLDDVFLNGLAGPHLSTSNRYTVLPVFPHRSASGLGRKQLLVDIVGSYCSLSKCVIRFSSSLIVR
jgi:hypothetical protein